MGLIFNHKEFFNKIQHLKIGTILYNVYHTLEEEPKIYEMIILSIKIDEKSYLTSNNPFPNLILGIAQCHKTDINYLDGEPTWFISYNPNLNVFKRIEKQFYKQETFLIDGKIAQECLLEHQKVHVEILNEKINYLKKEYNRVISKINT